MAKLQVMTLENLQAYDPLIKDYINDAVGTAEAKSLKTVAIDGKTLKFYKVAEPVGDTAPAYEITLPETDISGLLAKLTGATEGNVVVANADGTVKDGGVKLADLALKTEITALEEGAIKDVEDAIDVLNGNENTDGSVAKTVKDAVDVVDGKIGTLADLDTTAKTDLVGAINEVLQSVEAGGTGSVVTMTTDTTTDGYLKTYTIKQGTTEIGKIDIPKDLVVSSGEVVVDPDGQPAGTYVKLTIANQTTPVYINVADLVDAYTAQASATQIQLAISDTNEISATIVAGSVTATELATDSVTTVKIADGNVTLAKLGADVTPTLTQVATNKTNIEALQTLVGEGVTSISTDDINALFTP
jgi:hypothetical protein